MPKIEITECKPLQWLNKDRDYEGCPYFSKDREYGEYCSCASGGIWDRFFSAKEFPGCKFGLK